MSYDVDERNGKTRYDPYAFDWDFAEPAPPATPDGSGVRQDDFQLLYVCPPQFPQRFNRFQRMVGVFKSADERTAAKEFLIANSTPREFFRIQDDEARKLSERAFERIGFKTRCTSNWSRL